MTAFVGIRVTVHLFKVRIYILVTATVKERTHRYQENLLFHCNDKRLFEPRHDKTNKMSVRPAPSEDSDQSGHPPSLIRVFAAHMKKADAQVDLSLRWAHTHFVGFVSLGIRPV